MEYIKFQVNIKKALEAILYIASVCPDVGFHTICKIFFYADIYHINKYGRPVFGDEYRALQYGPVPQTTYDILKEDPLLMEALDEEHPFVVIKKGSKPTVKPRRKAQLEYFSKSDIEALDYAIENFSSLSFRELTDVSHEHPAWKNANFNGAVMKYEDFISDENKSLLEELKENSQFINI